MNKANKEDEKGSKNENQNNTYNINENRYINSYNININENKYKSSYGNVDEKKYFNDYTSYKKNSSNINSKQDNNENNYE